MPQKTRLANKTQWALCDIAAICMTASRRWDKVLDMAERNHDAAMLAMLARLRADIAVIERKAKDALNGEYEQEI